MCVNGSGSGSGSGSENGSGSGSGSGSHTHVKHLLLLFWIICLTTINIIVIKHCPTVVVVAVVVVGLLRMNSKWLVLVTAGLSKIDLGILIVAWRILFDDGDSDVVVSPHTLHSLPPRRVWNGMLLVVSSTTIYGIDNDNITHILLNTDKYEVEVR